MKHCMLFLVFCLLSFTQCMAQEQGVLAKMSTIERCLLIIRHWEQWHDNPRDAEYIGWGHRIQPHERHLNQNITRAQGDSLLYEDLRKLIIHYKRYGKDAALLSCLAYQVGVGKVDGNRTRPPSRLIQKIRAGRRNFKDDYLSFCRWRGKEIPSIKKRRMAELALLYEY